MAESGLSVTLIVRFSLVVGLWEGNTEQLPTSNWQSLEMPKIAAQLLGLEISLALKTECCSPLLCYTQLHSAPSHKHLKWNSLLTFLLIPFSFPGAQTHAQKRLGGTQTHWFYMALSPSSLECIPFQVELRAFYRDICKYVCILSTIHPWLCWTSPLLPC